MKKYKFDAELVITERGGYGVHIPFNVKKEFGFGGMLKVKAKIGGIDYRGSLTPVGNGRHMLIVLKKIREELGAELGDNLHIEFVEDKSPRVIKIPEDLQKLFNKNKSAKKIFEDLSYTHKKEYVEWINEAKREGTRQRRLHKTIEMLKENKHL